MKLLLTAILLLVPLTALMARQEQGPANQQELYDKAEMVVIARPMSNKDTPEQRSLPGMERVQVIGVETLFKVSIILKGSTTTKSFTLHHYRLNLKDSTLMIYDGPHLVKFDPADSSSKEYLLYLIREADGRYAPVAGQVDPADISVFELRPVRSSDAQL